MRWPAPLAAAALAFALLPASAWGEPDFGFVPDSAQIELLDAEGLAEHRAGAHPDRMITRFAFNATPGGEVEQNPRDISLELPPGMVGNANATPQCPRANFATGSCPADTQVGIVTQTFSLLGTMSMPVYNVAPTASELAEFGFQAFVLPSRFMIGLDPKGGHHVRLLTTNLPQEVPLLESELELWGVPADHQSGTAIPRKPLLTNPTRCDSAPEDVVFAVRTWQQPGKWLRRPAAVGPFEGCADLPFDPALSVTPSQAGADAPTGIEIELDLPQEADPEQLATAHAESVSVALPPGFSLSPGVAHGLSACTDAQLGDDSDPVGCPSSSKIGTAEFATPLLPEPLSGTIYLARGRPDDPFRMFVAVDGPGFTVKLPGSLRPDSDGNRVTALVPQLPQLPFSRLALHLKDGPRAPLASPLHCTRDTAEATATSSAGGTASATASVEIRRGAGGAPCRPGSPFAPGFFAGVSPARAGAPGSFSAAVTRRDGEQALAGLAIALPAGVSARLGTVEVCPEPLVVAAACPLASRVGSVLAEAGAGATPFGVGGDIYLTGPFGGAPFGLALVLEPAIGPFDLAPVAIRAALALDPGSGRIRVSVGALPTALSGIRLRLRTLGIAIDRPGFMVNPTSCRPASVTATLRSSAGASTAASAPFQLTGCRRLGFRPRLTALVRGGRAKHPSLTIRVRPRAGDANLRSVTLKLPALLRGNDGKRPGVCSRRHFALAACPRRSRVGSARVRTPLLSTALRGPAYLVRAGHVGAPQIWTALEGQGVRLLVRSVLVATSDGRLRTTLLGLPDQPLGDFAIRIRGGRGSLLSATVAPCAAGRGKLISASTIRAQNGLRRKRLLPVWVRPSCRRARGRARG